MGGEMSVNDSVQYPWIIDEIEFIKKVIYSGKIVIGVCLGAQLLAKALGANVYKNREPEMGFYPVFFNQYAKTDSVFKHFLTELSVMHLHFDTFDLPPGALAMAENEVTPVQAFRFGNNVFAFQFHFEITESNAPVFIREVAHEIIPGKYVQSPPEMLKKAGYCILNNEIFSKVLKEILKLS